MVGERTDDAGGGIRWPDEMRRGSSEGGWAGVIDGSVIELGVGE
jgi:hypothetical protein